MTGHLKTIHNHLRSAFLKMQTITFCMIPFVSGYWALPLYGSVDPDPFPSLPPCPSGSNTTIEICPYWEATNNFLYNLGLPETGIWEPPLQTWGGTAYYSCIDSASVYIYPHDYPGCPTVYDTVHFDMLFNPCGWQPIDICYTADSIFFTMPPFNGDTGGADMYGLMTSGELPSGYYTINQQFDFDSTNTVAVPIPSWYTPGSGNGCFNIILLLNGCWWHFGELILFDFTCVQVNTPCACSNPPYAGENGSIMPCSDSAPFDLTNALGGNPDPGGAWTPPLASGGNIYDPVLDGSGIFTYTVTGVGCPDDQATVTVTVLPLITPVIVGVPGTICENAAPIALPTVQSGIAGTWTGTGVINNIFNPAGLNGMIPLTFSPLPGQCAETAFTQIQVEPFISIAISGVPDSLCSTNPSVALPTIQSGINGIWSGMGIINNTFNPSGLNGTIPILFTPIPGECANNANTTIYVTQSITPVINGLPDTLCQSDPSVPLPVSPSGVNGNWTGPGVINNSFSPSGLSGNAMITFSPDAGQCAVSVSQAIYINAIFIPSLSGLPSSLCASSPPLILPVVQSGVTGNWSGQGVLNNVFDPSGVGGNILLTFTPDAGQCASPNTFTIDVLLSVTPVISGIPPQVCGSSAILSLSTMQDGVNGNWSGQGVVNNTFDPTGLNGNVSLTFTPDPNQCAVVATTAITVIPSITPILSGVPSTYCELNGSFPLSIVQDEVNGNWSGPGVINNLFNPSGLPGSFTLTFTPDTGQCANTATTDIEINPAVTPVITGIPGQVCHSDTAILLAIIQDSLTGTWSGPGVMNNVFYPSGLSGNLMMTFTPDSGQCAIGTGIPITVIEPPYITIYYATCLQASQTYIVHFEISGGDPGSYTVNGIPLNDTVFTSLPIDWDSPAYSFIIDDNTGCGPVEINGYLNCACATHAGTMDFTGNPLRICASSGISVAHLGDEVLDADDILGFVLHDQPGTLLGNILAVSTSPNFSVPGGILLGQVYYVSAIAGSNNGNGMVDLTDECLSVSPGVPIIFYEPVAIVSGGGPICPDACMTYQVQFEGQPPFSLEYQVMVNGQPLDQMVITDQHAFDLVICPMDLGMTEGALELIPISMSDINCSKPFAILPGLQSTVYPVAEHWLSPTLCDGESLLIQNVLYDQANPAGTEIISGGNIHGCDSIVHVALQFHEPATGDFLKTLCYGGNVVINGTVYNESNPAGMEVIGNGSVYGCDSTVHVQLMFDSLARAELNAVLCAGEEITIDGMVYDEAHTTDTILYPGGSVFGCDSVLYIKLSFHPLVQHVIQDTLFPGEYIVVNGVIYDMDHNAGSEVIPAGSQLGCDSVILINLYFRTVQLQAAWSSASPLCFGDTTGYIRLDGVEGGSTSYEVVLNGMDSFMLGPFPFDIAPLPAGHYTLLIRDNQWMAPPLAIVIVLEPPMQLQVDAGVDQQVQFGQDIELIGHSFTPVVSWDWTPPDFLSCLNCQSTTAIQPDRDLTYLLEVTDQNGCTATDQVSIDVVEGEQVFFPNLFSPNRDGINDEAYMTSSGSIELISSIRIYSRWGELVYAKENLSPGDPSAGWDGTYHGQDSIPGVYTWIAEVIFKTGKRRQMAGDLTLIR